jgi:hypothetical protein
MIQLIPQTWYERAQEHGKRFTVFLDIERVYYKYEGKLYFDLWTYKHGAVWFTGDSVNEFLFFRDNIERPLEEAVMLTNRFAILESL